MKKSQTDFDLLSFLNRNSLTSKILTFSKESQYYLDTSTNQLYHKVPFNINLGKLKILDLKSSIVDYNRNFEQTDNQFLADLLIDIDKPLLKKLASYQIVVTEPFTVSVFNKLHNQIRYKPYHYLVGRNIIQSFISDPDLHRLSNINRKLQYYPVLKYQGRSIYSDFFSKEKILLDPNAIYLLPDPLSLGRSSCKLLSKVQDLETLNYLFQIKSFVLEHN